jgi:hypothetical protein
MRRFESSRPSQLNQRLSSRREIHFHARLPPGYQRQNELARHDCMKRRASFEITRQCHPRRLPRARVSQPWPPRAARALHFEREQPSASHGRRFRTVAKPTFARARTCNSAQPRVHALVENMAAEFQAAWQSFCPHPSFGQRISEYLHRGLVLFLRGGQFLPKFNKVVK